MLHFSWVQPEMKNGVVLILNYCSNIISIEVVSRKHPGVKFSTSTHKAIGGSPKD